MLVQSIFKVIFNIFAFTECLKKVSTEWNWKNAIEVKKHESEEAINYTKNDRDEVAVAVVVIIM